MSEDSKSSVRSDIFVGIDISGAMRILSFFIYYYIMLHSTLERAFIIFQLSISNEREPYFISFIVSHSNDYWESIEIVTIKELNARLSPAC